MPSKNEISLTIIEEERVRDLVISNDAVQVKDSSLEIRSDEVQEILSAVPNWTIRWGITLIFTLIVILISLSWFVEYPDIISGSMVLTTENPPIRLVNKTSGKIRNLTLNEGDIVSEGQVIGTIESSVSNEEINWLRNYTLEVEQLLLDSSFSLGIMKSNYAFGDLQTAYNNLSKACFFYYKMQMNTYEKEKMKTLSEKIKNYTKLQFITKRQIKITKSELRNVKYVYDENLKLYNKETISKMELYNEESKFHQKQMELESLNKALAEQSINIDNLRQELRDLEFNYLDKISSLKKEIRLYLNNIQSGLENWELTYRLSSPIKGKLIYLSDWKNNQFIDANTPLFAVVPYDENYVVNVQIPSQGYGKVKLGQKVRIRLNGYPVAEYGYLTGVINSLADISTKGVYLAKVDLPKGLLTSYSIKVEFIPEMEGTAEIITDDLRVLKRLFIQFNKLSERKIEKQIDDDVSK